MFRFSYSICPAISAEFMERWLPQVVRSTDVGSLIVDANDPDVLGEIDLILRTLDSWRVPLPKLLIGSKLDLPGNHDNSGRSKNCTAINSAPQVCRPLAVPALQNSRAHRLKCWA